MGVVRRDWVARHWSSHMPDWFHYGDWIFCVLALMELFIRMVAQGLYFFYEAHWKWNLFDTVVVATQDSLQSLFWTMVLIFACLYAVAVVLTQLVSDHKIAIGHSMCRAELMDPLVENMGGWVRIVFVTFTGFELFAMMNIITACFVDSAMMIAANAEKQETREAQPPPPTRPRPCAELCQG
eukprot:g606.t1